jgi:hypothetical protein
VPYVISRQTIDHLLLRCVLSREVWFRGLQPCGWQHLTPQPEDNLSTLWLRVRKAVAKPRRSAFDSLCKESMVEKEREGF